ncbi:flagellar assembly protein FliW [Clostridium sp. C105KSO13]|uniref:flagellar assembly protein FliW n=1 Tax=Clostridium sp. C105KSO13 TaxID=1776045 RepID=UPI0007407EA9|nr:flagellar assembly protein FliW [Clostridium sp. C105KSO13]CUX49644.1 Flagellar assembly factor FliW [Clostridium sp. C105KSO13]
MEEVMKSSLFMEEELIYFREGLFGFEEYKTFIPLPVDETSDAVLCLQSTEDPELSFIIMNPFYLKEDYRPVLSSADYKKLGTEDVSLLSFYVVCVIGNSSEKSTVNLKCPIAVNTGNRQAVQVILASEEYRMRHTLNEFRKKGE